MLPADRPLLLVPGPTRFIVGRALARLGGAMFGVAAIAMISSRRRDSLFDSLPGAGCDTPGRSVTQARQTAEYARHVLTRPDASWQGRSISS